MSFFKVPPEYMFLDCSLSAMLQIYCRIQSIAVRNVHQTFPFPRSAFLSPKPSLVLESKRFMKPVKPVQYKYDFRFLEDKSYTHEPLKLPKLGGRDPETGRKVNQRIGGGIKFDFYWITTYPFVPNEGGVYEERVLEVRRDTNRSSFIALVAGRHGRRWILARDGLEAGDVVRMTNHIPPIPFVPKVGEIWPVGAIADGTEICCVETLVGSKIIHELRAIAAGSSVSVSGRKGDLVRIRLTTQKELLINGRCMATVGRMSNIDHKEEQWGSMNMKRRMGIKQGSGLWHRKDGYCGRKIHRLPPPLLVVPRNQPPERYRITLTPKDYSCGYGFNEYNPVLKEG